MKSNDMHEKFGVSTEQLDAWADEHENADWSHMRFSEIANGRPRIADEPLDSITVKIPRSRIIAMRRMQQRTGMTRSEFVRQAIDHELMSLA